MDKLRQQIRIKIADESLQMALDSNTARRLQGRKAAFDSLPNPTQRRQRAHAIRAEVIEHLDETLAQFIHSVQQNGFIVHRAKDAAEAVQIVLQIASALPQNHKNTGQALLFAKSKSMVSEEISLNHALEAAGHRVVETDLGEYIIQLRHERPSHIITPAVHLRRHQVGQLFHEKLGIPYTEDIPTLTNTARRVLRQVFLSADVGISGVNFGVAQTGTLAIVTNEGNGRMCTTLPPVHIALMGMERLLPSLDDLALFLSLLPRSSTGQKLSVYTQLIHRPLAGQVRHLIIVDNGRARLRQSPLRESLYCIRCGACLNACPAFREMGGHAYLGRDGAIAPYPGPIGSVISPGLLGDNFSALSQACSLCGACQEACPVDIDLPGLLLRVRAGEIPDAAARPGAGLTPGIKLGLELFTQIASHPRLYSASQKIAGWLAAPLPGFLPLPAVTGWGLSKDFPKPAASPFRERFRQLDSPQPQPMPQPAPAPVPTSASAAQAPSLVAQFTAELTALGGHVTLVSAPELTLRLIAHLRAQNIDRVEAWENLPALDTAQWAASGIRVEKSASEKIAAGITGALCALADTGSILLHSGPGRPLTASLLRPAHIVILRASQILPTLETALRLPEVAEAASVVVITGPSRTADIEMALTIGVHGPGEVQVFLVDDVTTQ